MTAKYTPLCVLALWLAPTPVTLNGGRTAPYGFGWMLANVRGHRLVHHPGGMPGARADIARFVDDELTVIVLMNLDDVDIDAIVLGIAAIYLPPPTPTSHGSGAGSHLEPQNSWWSTPRALSTLSRPHD